MSAFSQLCKPLQNCLINRGWKRLLLIQEDSFGPISEGNNVLLIAPTAGGKTEAAMLPLLNRLYLGQTRGVKLVYVAPLRALINNIENRFIETKLCSSVYFNVFKWHGDVTRSKKLMAARSLPDVLLTTPESLDVILGSPYIDKVRFFGPLESIIIDETHYFAGTDRGGQLVSVLSRLESRLNRDLQRVCLSATVGNASEVIEWMCYPSKRQKRVIQPENPKADRDVTLHFYDGTDSSASDKMTNAIVRASAKSSVNKKSIIFEPSRKAAEQRSKDFRGNCCICHVHHGSVDKFLREKAEFDLARAKSAAIIISTCSLELGIDVGDLDLIQQEGDLPNVSSYVQRIGRTGRVKPPQKCIAYATDEFEFLKNLAIILLADEGYVENNRLNDHNYRLLLQQLLMMALSRNGVRIDEVQTLLHSCAALKGITDSEWKDLLKYWISNDIIRIYDDMALVGAKIEQRYASTNYRDLYVLFDSPSSYEVRFGRSAIGTLDSLFVQSGGREFVFILAGKWWQVVDIDYHEAVVFVKSIQYVPPPAQWISPRGHEVGYQVAQRIKAVLLEDNLYPHILGGEDATSFLLNLRRKVKFSGLESRPCQIVPLRAQRFEIITYAGDRTNILLAEAITDLKKWKTDEINYASFQLELDKQPSQKSKYEIRDVLAEINRDATFDRPSLIKAIVSKNDIRLASKWSEWLPPDYRCKAIKSDLFDIEATKAWLRLIHK